MITDQQYLDFVLSKEIKDYKEIQLNERSKRILHALLLLSTEANELLDNFKKHTYYKKELDITNIIEEMGDMEFALAFLRDELNVSRQEVLERNMMKLNTRYKKGFTIKEAIERNLEEERKALETNNK